jgi:hypothetical protein
VQLVLASLRHLDEDISTIEQWAADPLLIAHDGSRRTGAVFDRVAKVATGTPMRLAVATNLFYLGCALIMSLGSMTDGTLQEKTLQVE